MWRDCDICSDHFVEALMSLFGFAKAFSSLHRIQQAKTTVTSSGGKLNISRTLITSAPAAANAPMKANRHSKNLTRVILRLRRPARSGQAKG